MFQLSMIPLMLGDNSTARISTFEIRPLHSARNAHHACARSSARQHAPLRLAVLVLAVVAKASRVAATLGKLPAKVVPTQHGERLLTSQPPSHLLEAVQRNGNIDVDDTVASEHGLNWSTKRAGARTRTAADATAPKSRRCQSTPCPTHQSTPHRPAGGKSAKAPCMRTVHFALTMQSSAVRNFVIEGMKEFGIGLSASERARNCW